MMQALPKILPVNELKNTANIIKTCQESSVPIVITKNGYGEAVMMSVKLYEETFAKIQVAALLNAGVDEADLNVESQNSQTFLAEMKEKYGK